MRWLPKWLRRLWAAPCSLVGLVLGLGLLVGGGSVRRVDGVLEFCVCRTGPAPAFPIAAITFGHVVLGLTAPLLEQLRAHERVHVAQYERWGVAFFVAYPASSLWQWLHGRSPYWHNRFEVDARRRSGPAQAARRPTESIGERA